jgi:hypothetical protein
VPTRERSLWWGLWGLPARGSQMTQQAHHPQSGRPEQVSLWEPAPRQQPPWEPPPAQPPWRPKPPWYRRAWFVGLVVVAVSATAGAVLGSHLP